VRELENAVERAVILSTSSVMGSTSLPDRIRQRKTIPLTSERATENPSLDAIERAYIMWVLGSEGGNKSRAAETLGIDPSTLHRKLFKFGVELV
jgi:two-component system response regulator HydG